MFGRVSPPPSSIHPWWAAILTLPEIHFFYSTVAVGFFFLASGFLIPLVQEPTTPGRFLVVRWFRIYPVWLLSFVLIAVILAAQAKLGAPPANISASEWLANAGIVTDLTGSGVVLNPVAWTLMIELKFYLLCALAAWTVGLHRAWPMVTLAAAWTAYGVAAWEHLTTLAAGHLHAWIVTQAVAWDAKHMPVIFIGVCFYNRFRKRWSTVKLGITSALLLSCLLVGHLGIRDDWGFAQAKFGGYVAAIVLFAGAYALRDRFVPSRIVRSLADLCYPIYTLHFVLSIVLLDAIVRLTRSPTVAILTTLLIIYWLSLVVHHWLERPAIELGKRVRWPLAGRATRGVDQTPG
jgi:peptidoglycan/LPS O-acetylase OafA/YrhL